jgi:hypothetical protein
MMKSLLVVFLLCALGVNAATSYSVTPDDQTCPVDDCSYFRGHKFARIYFCSNDNGGRAFTINTLPELQVLAKTGHRVVITSETFDSHGNPQVDYVISERDSFPIRRLRQGKSISRPIDDSILDSFTKVDAVWDGPDFLLNRLINNCDGNAVAVQRKLYDSCGSKNLDLEQQTNTGPFCSWNSDGKWKGNISVYVDFDNTQFVCPDDLFQCYLADGVTPGDEVTRNREKICEFFPCPIDPSGVVCATDISSCGTVRDPYHNCNFKLCWNGTRCEDLPDGCSGGGVF